MGYALALEAFSRGADVTVIAGPNDMPRPVRMEWIEVNTAEEMAEKVFQYFEKTDIFISAAAVADYAPEKVFSSKMKKQKDSLSLHLKPTVDILEEAGKRKKHQFLIGFALESEKLLEKGKEKLRKKNLDGIVINSAVQKSGGMGKDLNEVILLDKHLNQINIQLSPKLLVARQIFDFFFLSRIQK